MLLKDLFERNPFQNLVVATEDSIHFRLQGHIEQFDDTLNRIKDVVRSKDYDSNNLCHTIVFGEWGHGKTHVLKSLEQVINNEYKSDAFAIFHEPTSFLPKKIFSEISSKLGQNITSHHEFVTILRKNYADHIFLLIDESQGLVGEDIHGSYDAEIETYYGFLEDLLVEAEQNYFNLHIFHGFSANSAKAIDKMGKLPLVRKLNRYRFTLNSLSEQEQWEMVKEHIEFTVKKRDSFVLEEIIERDVNKAINNLTGGNPRWILMLMHDIFNNAQEKERIDTQTCYETLSRTYRIDNPIHKYFDPFIIENAIDSLKNGQVNENKIGGVFDAKKYELLGGWKSIDHTLLDSFQLKSTSIRRKCPSIEDVKVFEQDQSGEFSLTTAFRDETIKVYAPKTIITTSEKELLLRLSLEPESMLRGISKGFKAVLSFKNYPTEVENNVGLDKLDVLYFRTGTGKMSVMVGLVVYKGTEISQVVYEKMANRIIRNKCSVVIFIEDAITDHGEPGSQFNKFIEEYDGPLDLSSRFIFIDQLAGSDGFDEHFFVSLYSSANIRETAINLYNNVGIDSQIQNIIENSIYCPTDQEQTLLDLFLPPTGALNLKEIKEADADLSWVNRAELDKLSDYIEKISSKYTGRLIKEIRPIRFLLKHLKKSSKPSSESTIEKLLREEWILTGHTAAIEQYAKWCTNLLLKSGSIEKTGDGVVFVDIEKDNLVLKREFDEEKEIIESLFYNYEKLSYPAHELTHLKEKLEDVLNTCEYDESNPKEKKSILESCIQDLNEIKRNLEALPEKIKKILSKKLDSTQSSFSEFKSIVAWPYDELPDPFELWIDPLANKIENIRKMIQKDKLNVREIEAENVEVHEEIQMLQEELDINLPTKIVSEENSIDRVKYQLIGLLCRENAKMTGEVTIEYKRVN